MQRERTDHSLIEAAKRVNVQLGFLPSDSCGIDLRQGGVTTFSLVGGKPSTVPKGALQESLQGSRVTT